jgi:hypothetical protein
MEYRHRSLLQDLPPIEEDTDLEYSSQDRYGTSFSYYSTYILLAFVVIVATNNYSDLFDSKVRFTFFLCIVGLLLPLHALSWKLIPFFREYGQTQVSMTWSIGQIFILFYDDIFYFYL